MQTNSHLMGHDSMATVKPYAMLGAGKLASTVWKTGNELDGWRYRFNVFRLQENGRVEQKFRPEDVNHIVKLAQVLAATLADDGCLEPSVCRELRELASRLDEVTNRQGILDG